MAAQRISENAAIIPLQEYKLDSETDEKKMECAPYKIMVAGRDKKVVREVQLDKYTEVIIAVEGNDGKRVFLGAPGFDFLLILIAFGIALFVSSRRRGAVSEDVS